MSPRVGMVNSRRTVLGPVGKTPTNSPLRRESFSMTTPWYSSGTSTMSCSMGSVKFPSASRFVMTSGRETQNSIPSRRISSMRMAR